MIWKKKNTRDSKIIIWDVIQGCVKYCWGVGRVEQGVFQFHYYIAVFFCDMCSLCFRFPSPAWIPISVPVLEKKETH